MRSFIAILSGILLVAGCASGPRPMGAAALVPAGKQVSIKTDSENEHTFGHRLDRRIYITRVDDESTITLACVLLDPPSCYPQEVLVSPGRHYLDLRYQHLNSYALGKVWLDARPDTSYIVRRRVEGYSVQLWVEESGTGRTVGGIPGSEPEKQ